MHTMCMRGVVCLCVCFCGACGHREHECACGGECGVPRCVCGKVDWVYVYMCTHASVYFLWGAARCVSFGLEGV